MIEDKEDKKATNKLDKGNIKAMNDKSTIKSVMIKEEIKKVDENIYICNQCDKCFSSRNSMNNHVNFVHKKG